MSKEPGLANGSWLHHVQGSMVKVEYAMTDKIPHNALVVVFDGAGARYFRNSGQENHITLKADGTFKPHDLESDGPSGKRPSDSKRQETDEATFAKQLAHELYRRAHAGEFTALVLIADPQTLGQMRPLLHKEVRSRVVAEHAKTLTKASIADIQNTLG
jgi:protein required for attachment to host cells